MELDTQLHSDIDPVRRDRTAKAQTDIRTETRYLQTTRNIAILIKRDHLVANNDTSRLRQLNLILQRLVTCTLDRHQRRTAKITTNSREE